GGRARVDGHVDCQLASVAVGGAHLYGDRLLYPGAMTAPPPPEGSPPPGRLARVLGVLAGITTWPQALILAFLLVVLGVVVVYVYQGIHPCPAPAPCRASCSSCSSGPCRRGRRRRAGSSATSSPACVCNRGARLRWRARRLPTARPRW